MPGIEGSGTAGIQAGAKALDDLDSALLEAYGWQDLPADAQACSGGRRPPSATAVGERRSASALPHGIGAHRAPLQAPLADHLARGGESAEALVQTILSRLVALNHERAAEEKLALVRWLRPDDQAPGSAALPTGPTECLACDPGF